MNNLTHENILDIAYICTNSIVSDDSEYVEYNKLFTILVDDLITRYIK